MSTTKPGVTRDTFDAYRVRGGFDCAEWATICLREWSVGGESVDERLRYCGEILIHSTFGSWAHQWGYLSRPFRQFLLEAEFDYVFTKVLGEKFQVFDGEGSLENLR